MIFGPFALAKAATDLAEAVRLGEERFGWSQAT